MSDLSYYIKISTSPSGCNSHNAEQFKCDRYLDCESCLEDKIIEHDKQIRAEAINDYYRTLNEKINTDTRLKETIREIHDKVAHEMYCKAIEEYKNALLKLIKDEQDTRYGYLNERDIREVADQLRIRNK